MFFPIWSHIRVHVYFHGVILPWIDMKHTVLCQLYLDTLGQNMVSWLWTYSTLTTEGSMFGPLSAAALTDIRSRLPVGLQPLRLGTVIPS